MRCCVSCGSSCGRRLTKKRPLCRNTSSFHGTFFSRSPLELCGDWRRLALQQHPTVVTMKVMITPSTNQAIILTAIAIKYPLTSPPEDSTSASTGNPSTHGETAHTFEVRDILYPPKTSANQSTGVSLNNTIYFYYFDIFYKVISFSMNTKGKKLKLKTAQSNVRKLRYCLPNTKDIPAILASFVSALEDSVVVQLPEGGDGERSTSHRFQYYSLQHCHSAQLTNATLDILSSNYHVVFHPSGQNNYATA